MTSWDINPEGVKTALEATHTAALPLQEHAKAYGAAIEAVFPETGDFVGLALSDFATHYQYTLSDISAQVIASLNGAADATVAYMNGQQDMALSAQKNSRDASYKAAEERRLNPEKSIGKTATDTIAERNQPDSHEPTVVEQAVDGVGDYIGGVFGGGKKASG